MRIVICMVHSVCSMRYCVIHVLHALLYRIEEEFGLLPDLEAEEDKEVDDEDGPIYNPLNLPLGWDGKPIPYWLYKLHGLGKSPLLRIFIDSFV